MLITVVKDLSNLITYRSDLSWVGTKALFFFAGGGCSFLFCIFIRHILWERYTITRRAPNWISYPLIHHISYKGLVINNGEGGGYKMGKSRVQNFMRPPSRQGQTFHAPF